MIAAVATLMFVVSAAGATLVVALQTNHEQVAHGELLRARLAADSGLADAMHELQAGVAADVGSPDQTVDLGGSRYWVDVVDNGDDTFTLTASGSAGREAVRVESVVRASSGGIFQNALFAGNSSGDPDYVMKFGGVGGQADDIQGDIYSGANVAMTGDSSVDGTIRAIGDIDGAAGEANAGAQPIPDLAGMNYDSTADFDVADMFGSASWQSDNAGGSAWQLPESSPGHIFRKNPSDRPNETSSTAKDDYFLEDPYEPIGVDSAQDGSNPFGISLSGVSGEPGVDSNHKVFFIDGNLWLHNKKSYSFQFKHHEADGVQITFVVKGNIYFSDNLFYADPVHDGVAFIAMKDADVEDSGNIYLGDPEFGTLQEMHAFMYAENDFHDVNLDASGSAKVKLYGNMTAGNHVKIERDYGSSHTKLAVDFDERIMNDELDMPGLPGNSGADDAAYEVVSWQRLPIQEAAP